MSREHRALFTELDAMLHGAKDVHAMRRTVNIAAFVLFLSALENLSILLPG